MRLFDYYLGLAWQRCRRRPATAILIALTLAIGIASCMTALTIFAAFEGEPLPGISPHLYVVTMDARESASANDNGYTHPHSLLKLRDARALVDAQRASAQMAVAASNTQVSSPDGKHSDVVDGLLAYGPVLRELGVPLRFGRAWTVQEQSSHTPVVVIDSKLAVRLFGTESAVGRSVVMNEHRFRVVGVTASWKPRMQFIQAAPNGGDPLGWGVQIFVPIGAALDAGVGPANSGACGRSAANTTYGSVDVPHCRWLEIWVTLKSLAARDAYQRFLSAYAQAQHAAGRFVHLPQARLYGTRSWMALKHVVPDDVSLNVLLAAAFLVLCMTNVVGLLTARFMRWRVDTVVRRALGASWRQLLAQHLVESGLLGLLGGLLALPLTLLGMWVVREQPVGYADAAQFSPFVFVGLLLLALVVGMIVGIWPAWRVCRLPPALQIKQT